MKVNIEEVLAMLEYRRSINRAELRDIEWYYQGKKLEVDQKELDVFEMIGLNNLDAINYILPEIRNILP